MLDYNITGNHFEKKELFCYSLTVEVVLMGRAGVCSSQHYLFSWDILCYKKTRLRIADKNEGVLFTPRFTLSSVTG